MREKEMPMKKSRTRIDKGRKFPFIDFDRGMVFEFGNLLLTRISLCILGGKKYLTGGQISEKLACEKQLH